MALTKILTIDYHTQGGPVRIPRKKFKLKGISMMDKKELFSTDYAETISILMREPRGHKDMFGAVICEPSNSNCDIGVIFIDGSGSLNMCGHGIMAVAAHYYENCSFKNGITNTSNIIKIDTPSGVVECKVLRHGTNDNGKYRHEVKMYNVPAFLEKTIHITMFNSIFPVHIVFGGNYFGVVDISEMTMPKRSISTFTSEKIIEMGMAIKSYLNANYDFFQPGSSYPAIVDLIEISEKVSKNVYKNRVIFGEGQMDRSPCGTGTTAKLVTLEDSLNNKEEIKNYSVSGGVFRGSIINSYLQNDKKIILTEIIGITNLIGYNKFILNSDDEIGKGFNI